MARRPCPRLLSLFLCHASGDKAGVRTLCDLLESDGARPWLDEREILPGQDWEAEILRALRKADIILVCLLPRSVTKEGYVQKEIALALDISLEKPSGTIFLVPVRLEECEVPERLKRLHWVDFYADGGYEKLLASCAHRADQLGLKLQTKTITPLVRKSKVRRIKILHSAVRMEPPPIYQAAPGESVRVISGALAGIEGILVKRKDSHRVVLNIAMLQRHITVEIDADWIVPIINRPRTTFSNAEPH